MLDLISEMKLGRGIEVNVRICQNYFSSKGFVTEVEWTTTKQNYKHF